MAGSLQSFLAHGVQKASDDLVEAFLRIPEDKRNWSPMGDARTALDQVAEVAILTGSTADLMATRTWDGDMDAYFKAKAELVDQGWDCIKALLDESVSKAVAAIQAVPNADLDLEIQMPWGPMTLQQIMSYPYWNACYHEGQINYIASMLGCMP